MADATYNRGFAELEDQGWEGSDIRVLLLKDDAGLTFDATHNFVEDVLDEADNAEADDSNYSRQTLSSKSATEDDSGDRLVIDHGDVTFSDLDGDDVGAMVYFRHVTDDTDSPVWFYKDSGFPFSPNGSDLVVSTGSDGVVTVADA